MSARGWESASDKKLRSRKVVRYGDGVEEADSDEEYEEFSDFEENEEEEGEEDRVFRDVVSAEERRKIELQFERTLEEYDDDEIGDLEDVGATRLTFHELTVHDYDAHCRMRSSWRVGRLN